MSFWFIFPIATGAKQSYTFSSDLHITVNLEAGFKLCFQETFSLSENSECYQMNLEPVMWVVLHVYCALELGSM